ncbi:hypothetical protein QP162_05205 [Sphingomonas aurantiaca]|uniref:hypothetical protein n=1 Tax=Sphingomonas aurantiaca TaxID=185949 RepID=UPI002FDFEEDD
MRRFDRATAVQSPLQRARDGGREQRAADDEVDRPALVGRDPIRPHHQPRHRKGLGVDDVARGIEYRQRQWRPDQIEPRERLDRDTDRAADVDRRMAVKLGDVGAVEPDAAFYPGLADATIAGLQAEGHRIVLAHRPPRQDDLAGDDDAGIDKHGLDGHNSDGLLVAQMMRRSSSHARGSGRSGTLR